MADDDALEPPVDPVAQPRATRVGDGANRHDSVTDDEDAFPLGLSRGDVRFALACGALIVLLLLAHWAQRALDGARLVEIDRLPANTYEFRLDINSATWVEWMQLEGVGEVLARRIVADRSEHGPFRSVDDLSRVSGVGPKTLDAIRLHLFCSDCPPADDAP